MRRRGNPGPAPGLRSIGGNLTAATAQEKAMSTHRKKPPARTARTGGLADLMAGDPDEMKDELRREAPRHPQGAGGIDPAADSPRRRKRGSKRRVARVLR